MAADCRSFYAQNFFAALSYRAAYLPFLKAQSVIH
jgi:hypothetical protein